MFQHMPLLWLNQVTPESDLGLTYVGQWVIQISDADLLSTLHGFNYRCLIISLLTFCGIYT